MKNFTTTVYADHFNVGIVYAYLRGKLDGEAFEVYQTLDQYIVVSVADGAAAAFFELRDFDEMLNEMVEASIELLQNLPKKEKQNKFTEDLYDHILKNHKF